MTFGVDFDHRRQSDTAFIFVIRDGKKTHLIMPRDRHGGFHLRTQTLSGAVDEAGILKRIPKAMGLYGGVYVVENPVGVRYWADVRPRAAEWTRKARSATASNLVLGGFAGIMLLAAWFAPLGFWGVSMVSTSYLFYKWIRGAVSVVSGVDSWVYDRPRLRTTRNIKTAYTTVLLTGIWAYSFWPIFANVMMLGVGAVTLLQMLAFSAQRFLPLSTNRFYGRKKKFNPWHIGRMAVVGLYFLPAASLSWPAIGGLSALVEVLQTFSDEMSRWVVLLYHQRISFTKFKDSWPKIKRNLPYLKSPSGVMSLVFFASLPLSLLIHPMLLVMGTSTVPMDLFMQTFDFFCGVAMFRRAIKRIGNAPKQQAEIRRRPYMERTG
jgi:hypothetical protein